MFQEADYNVNEFVSRLLDFMMSYFKYLCKSLFMFYKNIEEQNKIMCKQNLET